MQRSRSVRGSTFPLSVLISAWVILNAIPFSSGAAQLPPPRRVFQHFDSTAGLSHDNVYDIIQDHFGFIWLATENGLNRYDGVDVLSLKNDPRNPLSLVENDINAIIEDRSRRIWIGTWGRGVDCLDPENLIFRHMTSRSSDGFSLVGCRVLCLQEDNEGFIWVGTWNSGIFRIDPLTEVVTHYPSPDAGNPEQPEQDHVWNLIRDRKGILWIGTQRGLFIMHPGPSFERVEAKDTWVRAMTPAEQSGIFFNNEIGIFQADWSPEGIRKKLILRLDRHTAPTVLFLDHRNILWAGSRRHGLFRIDPSSGKFEVEAHRESDARSLAYDNIRAIMEDRSHNLWIATRGGGADRLDLKPPKFRSLTRRDAPLPSDRIWAFLVDHRGDLWIGTDNGLTRFPADGSTPESYQPDRDNSVNHEKIRALAEDRDGYIWIGTKGGGLDRLDPERRIFTHFPENPADTKAPASNLVTALQALPDGSIWIGTDDHGVDSYDPVKKIFIHHEINPELPGGNRVSTLAFSARGKLWVGTDGGGICLIDPETGKLSHINSVPPSVGHIHAVAEDQKGTTYIGTHSGLYILDRRLEPLKVVTEENGLPDNTIYGIIPVASSGELWMTTNQGLVRYNPQSGNIRTYGVDDGLVSMGFNDGAAYRAPDGRIFVGGARGLNYFSPEAVKENPFPPEILLTEISGPGGKETGNIEADRKLVFPYRDNSLVFRWIGLEFTRPAAVRYSYHLQGFDTQWIDGDSARERRYTNLPAGSYVFELRAANNDEIWSPILRSPEILIRRPYWKHPAFLGSALILLGLLFLLSHRMLSLTVHRRNRELEEQMQLRIMAEEKATRYAGELEKATLFDPLTGLPNRALISDRIRVLLGRCQRHPESSFAVLVLDLDEFRIINDSLGHRLGDELLRQMAERLKTVIRSDDTLGRLGGDEFAIILHNTTSSTGLEDFAERVHQILKPAFHLDDREVFSTASIGMVMGCTDYSKPEELLRDADTAMYRAKRLGRARQVLFDPGMHLEASNLLKLENNLRRGLQDGEFLLHYQPIIDLQEERLVAFEALVRWKSPEENEIVPPHRFLDRIRSAGLARELGSWVLEECCRTGAAWHHEEPGDIGLAVNLFTQQILDPGLPEQLRKLLETTDCPPSVIHLEITEEVLIDAPESAIKVLSMLKENGVEIHLDDFGSGFSSLSYLQRFPVDIVKIDKSFVTTMLLDLNAAKIVEAVILLAHGLGKKTIAEGIETADTGRRLRELGCDLGQGYYFSRPVPEDEARRIIRNPGSDWLGRG